MNILYKGARLGKNPDTASDNYVKYSLDGGNTWRNLPLYLQYVNHSPTGFNWGYYGSGPSQLAFAILHHYLTTTHNDFDILNRGKYQTFKQDFVAKWGNSWEISGKEIDEWLDNSREVE